MNKLLHQCRFNLIITYQYNISIYLIQLYMKNHVNNSNPMRVFLLVTLSFLIQIFSLIT